ncbi:MAG: hypothetical protein MJA84_04205 [Firmicutes bacterium]|nr:hypothetical protein [Bacillota bacterium]
MATEYEGLVRNLIGELLEYNFRKIREADPDIKNREKRIVQLSSEVNKITSCLDEANQKIIEEYINGKYKLSWDYNIISYIYGFKDCLQLIKELK